MLVHRKFMAKTFLRCAFIYWLHNLPKASQYLLRRFTNRIEVTNKNELAVKDVFLWRLLLREKGIDFLSHILASDENQTRYTRPTHEKLIRNNFNKT